MSSKRPRRPRTGGKPAVSLIKRVVNRMSETKYLQDSSTIYNVAPTTSGLLTPLSSLIVTGDGVNQRDGYKIFLRSLAINGYVAPADNPFNAVRIMILKSKGIALTSGVCPAVASVYDPHYMQVLYDKQMILTYSGATVGQSVPVLVKKTLYLNMPLTYVSTTGASSTDDIYIWLVSDSAAGPNPTWYCNFTLAYKDI